MIIINGRDVSYIQASGDELRYILTYISNIPIPNPVLHERVQPDKVSWYGDHAKFIVKFLDIFYDSNGLEKNL